MKIETIIDRWIADSKLDNIALDTESLKIPLLHGKYLSMLSKVRLEYKLLDIKRHQLRSTLSDYYRGNLNNNDDLKRISRSPWPLKILKQDISQYIEGDQEMVDLCIRIAYQGEMVSVLEEILKSINTRSFTISNTIKWKQLTQFGDV